MLLCVTTIRSGFHLTRRPCLPQSDHTSAAHSRLRSGGKTSMAKTGKNDPTALSALPASAPAAAPRADVPRPARRPKGLSLPRRVTAEGWTGQDVFDHVEWTRRPAKISGADGEIVFKMDD